MGKPRPPGRKRLAVTGASVTRDPHGWRTYHSFGQIIDELGRHVGHVAYHAPQALDEAACDYRLSASNLSVRLSGAWGNSLGAMKHPLRLAAGYWRLVGDGDAVLVRGSGPLNWLVHLFARVRGRAVVHWLVGNPLAIIGGAERGYSAGVRRTGILFARFERLMLRVCARLSRATLLVNGEELARIFSSPRTIPVVSTSITREDLHRREDTCSGEEIRLLYMGFQRPEKGIEYLIEALPAIINARPRLTLVGSSGPFTRYADRLKAQVERLGVSDRVSWLGHVPFGPNRFRHMDEADVLVLPTLSEGTPRVLVEARVRCLPVVATRVGGIPSSVADGKDGLLVPPADPAALAEAVLRVASDASLRRRLIAGGFSRVQSLTVDRFAVQIRDALGWSPMAPAGAF